MVTPSGMFCRAASVLLGCVSPGGRRVIVRSPPASSTGVIATLPDTQRMLTRFLGLAEPAFIIDKNFLVSVGSSSSSVSVEDSSGLPRFTFLQPDLLFEIFPFRAILLSFLLSAFVIRERN